MNWLPTISVLPLLATLSFVGPAMALGGGSIGSGQVESITRQVEQQAQRKVEQSMDRKLEQQVRDSIAQAASRMNNLPHTLSIRTEQGDLAFRDVLLDGGARAVERQWLATGKASEMSRLEQPGITLLDRQALSGLGMTVVRFRVSAELDSRKALEAVLPGLALDRNHIYAPQAEGKDAKTGTTEDSDSQGICTVPVGIGMIDTSIATEHPMLQDRQIVQQRFLTLSEAGGTLPDAKAHGTAVASVMVGRQQGQASARLPAGRLFNASVFYNRKEQDLSGATLGHLLEGLNWLANQPLSVINISLTGPDNRLLSSALEQLTNQGIVMVAAVGNQGPSAPPLYPAAYPEVIGVTAVNRKGEIYRWANHGEQVMFAAHGVDVPVAHPDQGSIKDSGTSLAAPVVTAAVACRLARLPKNQVIPSLIEEALDLGKEGRDQRFGHGLLVL